MAVDASRRLYPPPNLMISEARILALLADLESASVERTRSQTDTAKFCEAICAFANDMPGRGERGYLLIGADDRTGEPTGIRASDELLRNLAGLAENGNILPPPAIAVGRVSLSDGRGDIVVVEVQPSDLPPVRYRGRVWIRRGPRKAIANEAEEAILLERRTAHVRSFDVRPCRDACLEDLAVDLFLNNYLPLAVDPEILAENHRPLKEKLATLRFYDLKSDCPTHAGLLLFGKDVLSWLPNAFVQYVRFEGVELSDEIAFEKQFLGDLLTMTRDLAAFVGLLSARRPERVSSLAERAVSEYPEIALRELLVNAILHRSYEAPAPVRFYQFDDRIEIQNPGPLFGLATPENFPSQTSYRNPVLAEAMKTLGIINRFGRGVYRAQSALERNGSPPAEFIYGDTHFGVIIRKPQ